MDRYFPNTHHIIEQEFDYEIGLGNMGLAMATNLQNHLRKLEAPSLRYFNRTISRGQPLEELGGQAAASVADLVKACDIIFISVRDTSSREQPGQAH